MFDVLSMPCDWPVEVTYHEAKAYCRWKGPGYRLPSEAEHNAIREKEVCIIQNVIRNRILIVDLFEMCI